MSPPARGGRRPHSYDEGGGSGYGRRRRRRQRAHQRRRRTMLLLVAGGAIVVVLLTVGFGAGAALSTGCSLSSLRPVQIGENSFVYAADGSLLGSIPAEKNRQPISLAQMSPWLPRATVAIEDRRFWEHGGVDYVGILRAAWRDLSAGKVVEGGSTITQQLVRNLYIGHSQRTFQRKLTEACLAVKLSERRSKTWILQTYMNQVYYGNQAYGIEAASQTYFSKPAEKLTILQAALLAGLPQAPSDYDPFHAPQKAFARRAEVLKAMFVNGDITRRQYQQGLRSRSLGLKPGKLYTTIREPYFFSYVIDELQKQYGTNTVRSGGLKVYTTIDPRLQKIANAAMHSTLNERSDPSSALVAINPRTGGIRAMAAVIPGDKSNQYNLVSQMRRQSGSTFKTFALTAAVAEGINPDSTYYMSAPFTCDTGAWCLQPWHVETYGHTYLGWTSLTRATLSSDNTVYAQLTLDVGPDKVRAMAERLGLDLTGQNTVASIGLGTLLVSPLDMASAYATIAAGGIYSKPTAIRRVVLADGKEDTAAGWGNPDRTRVIPDWVAAKVTDVLEQNIKYGTGYPNATLTDRPAAGKTGTTSDWRDAWFCGFTPRLSTTVWVGYPKAEIPMTNVHGIPVTGGSFPAMIWHKFMVDALGKTPAVDFPQPATEPVWNPDFVRGHYGLGYVPTTPSSSTTDTTSTGASATATTASTGAPATSTTPSPPSARTTTTITPSTAPSSATPTAPATTSPATVVAPATHVPAPKPLPVSPASG